MELIGKINNIKMIAGTLLNQGDITEDTYMQILCELEDLQKGFLKLRG